MINNRLKIVKANIDLSDEITTRILRKKEWFSTLGLMNGILHV